MQPISKKINQTFLVTGSNRGLGFELMLLLLRKNPQVHAIGTTRSNKNNLQNILKEKTQSTNFTILQLDVTSKSSIQQLFHQLENRNLKIDALVNNSGIYLDQTLPQDPNKSGNKDQKQIEEYNNIVAQMIRNTMLVNFYGVVNLTQSLMPFINHDGRIINVSSRFAGLKHCRDQKICELFASSDITFNDIDSHINNYIQAGRSGNHQKYHADAYSASKLALNTWNRFILSRQIKSTQSAIAMAPGNCRTQMSGPNALRSAQEGAQAMYELLWGNYESEKFYNFDGPSDYINCGE